MIAEFTRQQVEAGETDPDKIAAAYLAMALSSDNPSAYLYTSVRSDVGSAFSSLQRVLRSERLAGQAGSAASPARGSQAISGRAPDLTRQSHNAGLLWHPPTRRWVDFADATVPQIQDAIDFYEDRMLQLNSAITEFRAAIAEIQSVPGATCLRDVWASREKAVKRRAGQVRRRKAPVSA